MSDYKKIVAKILNGSVNKRSLNESIMYPEGMRERMNPKLEDDLINRTHSLGNHPIFPESDESTFEEKVMGERFNEVVKRYKRCFDVNSINGLDVMKNMVPLLRETIGLEAKHRKILAKIAVDMIREEFDMSEDVVEIHAELTTDINMVGTKKNQKPMSNEIEFKNHDEIVNAKDEVYRRRFINAMIQGAAKKTNHMFHLVDDEIAELDPRLPNRYSKLMAAADYMYFLKSDLEDSFSGGVVRVQFPTKSNPKAIIYAQAMVLPVLIHELVKGVMELLSGHALPKNKKLGEYVINKADFLNAEPWDMRLGAGIWGRFTNMIDPDDFNLKHHIYVDLISLPVKEFNYKMREIMGGTKEGKKIIKDIVDNIKREFQEDEFNEAMSEINNHTSSTFKYEDLFNKTDNPEEDEGFNFDDLFS